MGLVRANIPNIITLGSVGCGFASLMNLIEQNYNAGMLFFFLAIIFDAADGKVASLLDARSEIGSTLDSLSDVVSFAFIPGVSLYLFYWNAPQSNWMTHLVAWGLGIGYAWAGILREVRFVSTQMNRSRAEGFVGLPIAPPAGLAVSSLALANLYPETLYNTPGLILVLAIFAAIVYLMTVSKLIFLRWGGKAIGVQTAVSLVIGAIGYAILGSFGAFLAIYFMSFCLFYILGSTIYDLLQQKDK